jgi:type I restriction enzyme S subunit
MHQLLTNGIGHTEFKETEIGRIPEGWRVVSIGGISKVVRGSTPRPAGDPRYFGGELPWITVSELTKDENIYLVETGARITEEGARRSRNIRPGTLLLGNSGFSLGVPKITKISGYINDGIAAFLDISPELDTLFMYYCLASLTQYFRFVIARGVDQPNLNTTLISKVKIQLPPLLEQKEIAEKLSAIDHKLQNEEKRLETLRFLKKGLMQDLLTGKVRVKVD